MVLISEKIAQEAIIEAVMTIEEVSRIAQQASHLYESQNTLNESARRMLNEDLNKAMKELQTSSQASMGKIDDAIKFIDMFGQVCAQSKQSNDDVWALLEASFGKAKSIVADFASLKLGTIDSVKSMFKDGGKYAAVMDNLASEMSIMSVFIKILSAGFAQAIRISETLPAEYKTDPNNKKGNVTLADYVNGDPSGELSSDELEKGVKTMMSDIQQKNGGYAFSMKGIKNFFKKNKGSMGMAAIAGGLAFFTGGLALPGILGALALGSAAKKKLTREPDDACGAYDTSIDDVAAAMLRTPIAALEGGVPLFVKAVKGASVEEFAAAAAEAQQTVQTITSGIDANDLLTKYVEEYGANAQALSDLYALDPQKTATLLQNFMNEPNSLKGTAIYDDLVNLKEKYLMESVNDNDDLLFEDYDFVHDYGLGDLLFETPVDEKRRKGKKRKKKPTSKSRKSSKSTKSSKSSKTQKGAQNKKQDKQGKSDDKAAARKKYTKAKATIKSYGKKQLSGAEKKPSTKNIRVKAVDKKEDQLNKGLKDINRKRQITKIADDFEKKIKAIDAEEAGTAPDTPDVDTTAADTGAESEESGTAGKVAAAGAAGAGAAAVTSGDDAEGDAGSPSQELVNVADKVDSRLPDATPSSTRDDLRDNLYGKDGAPSIPEIETSIEKDTEKDVNITSIIDRVTSGKPAQAPASQRAEPAAPEKGQSEKSDGAIDFSNADIAALSKMPALADIFGAKKRTEKQDKYLKTLMGESYYTSQSDYVINESYDRRLLRLAGIK